MARKAVTALLKAGVKKMGSNDRRVVEEELKQIADDLGGRGNPEEESRPDLLQEKFRLVARKKQIEEMLNKDDDLVSSAPGDKDRTWRREKELRAEISNGQLTARQEATMPKNAQDFEIAVKKQIAHQKANLGKIQEWQQLKRRLEPENPMCDDVMLLK